MKTNREEHVQSRRDILRGGLSISQTENFHFVSRKFLESSKRTRMHHHKNTTAGNGLADCPLPDNSNAKEVWHLSFKDKKELYGTARILPGGCVDDGQTDSNTSRASVVRRDTDMEPVTYHGTHFDLLEELVHQIGAKGNVRAIIDLTATDPTLAEVAMEWQTPFLGTMKRKPGKCEHGQMGNGTSEMEN